jgi:hypothetical protein
MKNLAGPDAHLLACFLVILAFGVAVAMLSLAFTSITF